MSNQTKYRYQEAGKPSNEDGSVDQFYNDLATKSANIGQDNTRTEWVSRYHVNFGSAPALKYFIQRENTSGSQDYTSTAYTTISHGNNGSTEQTFTRQEFGIGDTLRVNFSFRTGQDNGYLSQNKDTDYYWVEIELLLDSGGGSTWQDIGFPMRYSLGTHRATAGFDYPAAGYRMYSGTFIEIPGYTGGVSGIRARVKVEDATSGIEIEKWNCSLQLIGA